MELVLTYLITGLILTIAYVRFFPEESEEIFPASFFFIFWPLGLFLFMLISLTIVLEKFFDLFKKKKHGGFL